MPFSRTSLLSVESESARPVGLGKMSPELSGSVRAAFRTSSAGAERGTRWGRLFLARSAGTVQSLALRSISCQRAPRTSPLRAAVRTRNPKASFVPAQAPEACHGRESSGDFAVGQRLVVLDLVAVAGQRPADRGGWVVGAVAFGDGPRHDGADAAFEFPCRFSARLPHGQHDGEHVLGGDLGDGAVGEARVGEAPQR